METRENLLREILDNNPSPDTILIILRKLKDKGALQSVIRECNSALDIFPNELRIRRLLAESYTEAGQINQAESELKMITSYIGNFISSFKSLAKIYNMQGKKDEAFNYLKIYSACRPDDYEASQFLDSLLSPIEIFEREIQPGAIIPPGPMVTPDREEAGLSHEDIDVTKVKKEMTIKILESWQGKIMEKTLPA